MWRSRSASITGRRCADIRPHQTSDNQPLASSGELLRPLFAEFCHFHRQGSVNRPERQEFET